MAFGNRASAQERTNQGGENAYDNSRKHELRSAPGESVIFRFTNMDGEPFCYDRHSSASRSVRQTVCGRSAHGPGTCKMCEACAQADARNHKQTLVKGGGPRQAFSVVSFRPMFKDVPYTGNDGQVRQGLSPRACDERGQPLKIMSRKVPKQGGGFEDEQYTELYPNGQHEHDGVYHQAFEGLKVLNVSGSKRRPEGDSILKLDAELESLCRCGSLVANGLVQQPATVQAVAHACASCGKRHAYDITASAQLRCSCGITAQPLEVLQCQANCGNPQRDSILNRFIMMTKTGSGLDSTLSFKAMPAGQMSPEHAALLIDGNGQPLRAKFDEIYPYNPELEAKALRSIAPQLGSIGVMVEPILQGMAQGQQGLGGGQAAVGGNFGGLGGGLPNFGQNPGSRPAVAGVQSPTFPAGLPMTSVPTTPVVQTVTTTTVSGTPLSTSGTIGKGPPPAIKLGLNLGPKA